MSSAVENEAEFGIDINEAAVDFDGLLCRFIRMQDSHMGAGDIAIDKAWMTVGFAGQTARSLSERLDGTRDVVRSAILPRPRYTPLNDANPASGRTRGRRKRAGEVEAVHRPYRCERRRDLTGALDQAEFATSLAFELSTTGVEMALVAVLEMGRSPARKSLQEGQCSRVLTLNVATGTPTNILISDALIESPNWTPDGRSLVVNSNGLLYRLSLDDGSMRQIETGSLNTCNNDHILSPDGKRIYLSASGHLYVVPIEGGEPRKLSNDHGSNIYSYWLHGVSPDERWLSYVATEAKGSDPRGHRYIALLPAEGGEDIAISDRNIAADGPEFSPDGKWIYFNSEAAAKRPGHSQIFRMRPDGSDLQQLTFDEYVNWFPHSSPDGSKLVYLAYEPGTISHPADVHLKLRIMPSDGGKPSDLHDFFGGQGSLNVNSWSPDGQFIALIDYPARQVELQ